MSNKSVVMRECDRANKERKVSDGNVEGEKFFQNIGGDLLMSGMYACDTELLMKMISTYIRQKDMPTIVLTSHESLLSALRGIPEIIVFDDSNKEYHPMYGMNVQQICRLIRQAGEEWGCMSFMDRVLLYAMAVMETVGTRYRVSLPAISQLLIMNDDEIADLALQEGKSAALANNIRGNQEAGILFRRIVERLEKTFENVAVTQSETGYSLWQTGTADIPHAAFYQYSQNQNLMNTYLKEELYSALQQNRRLRVIADEILVVNEKDELRNFLIEMKRIGKIELILCSENAGNILDEKDFNFTNACVFAHASVSAMEKVSQMLFGEYLYHYPVQTRGNPPKIMFTLKTDEHWTIATEKRLKVREIDLYSQGGFLTPAYEKMAVKIGQKSTIFLVPMEEFRFGARQNLLTISV